MTFVLIPGAGGQASYWQLVADELRSRGHEAVPIDLAADDDTKDIPDYSDVMLASIDGRTEVTVVAYSMGAFTVPSAGLHGGQTGAHTDHSESAPYGMPHMTPGWVLELPGSECSPQRPATRQHSLLLQP